MKREELEAIMISANGDSGYMYEKDDADSVMDSLERRITRLTWCVDAWKKANADLQRANTRLRKAISINSLKEIEYMYAENADLKKRVKELEEENKHLDDYIDTYQKSEALNIEKLDKKDERIKELVKAKRDILTRNVELIGENAQLKMQVRELEATISKMETTTPKWISVKDRLPKGNPMLPALTEDGNKTWWGNWHDGNLEIYGMAYWLENAFPPPPTTEEK